MTWRVLQRDSFREAKTDGATITSNFQEELALGKVELISFVKLYYLKSSAYFLHQWISEFLMNLEISRNIHSSYDD
jgi:hypothetical protein